MATHSSVLAWDNPVDGGAWRATVHRVARSRTRLKRLTHGCMDTEGRSWEDKAEATEVLS